MNELYYDHYKETCELQRNNEQKRNKYFIYFTISIIILLLTTKYENNIYTYFKDMLQIKYGINITIESNIMEIFIWLITIYLNLLYYQINATIEKNYKYIHNIEKNLKFNSKCKISRESDNYLKIIDYKSSNKDLDISLAIQGFNIQMLLYLDTLASKQQLDLGGLLYFNTKKRILSYYI